MDGNIKGEFKNMHKVQIKGHDGTYTRSIAVDSNGRVKTVNDNTGGGSEATPTVTVNYSNYVKAVQVGSDLNFPFASPASTPANTQVTATLAKPSTPVECYDIHVYNPSTVSDLTVKLFSTVTPWSGAGGQAYSYIDSLTIPKSQSITGTTINAYKNQVYGLFNMYNLYMVMSNNSAMTTAVTPVVRVTEFR